MQPDSTRLVHDKLVNSLGYQMIKLQCHRIINARRFCCKIEYRVEDSFAAYVLKAFAQAGHVLLTFLGTASQMHC